MIAIRLLVILISNETSICCWLVERFPTVESRCAGASSSYKPVPASNVDLVDALVEGRMPPGLLQCSWRVNRDRTTVSLHCVVADEAQLAGNLELVSNLQRLIHSTTELYKPEDYVRVLLALRRAIPFGEPIETLPEVVLAATRNGHGTGIQDNSKTAKQPILRGSRALPHYWLMVSEQSPQQQHSSHSWVLSFSRPQLSFACVIRETLHAILYKHEAEFSHELDSFQSYLGQGTLSFESNFREPHVVTIEFAPSNAQPVLGGMSDFISRFQEEDGSSISFIPPISSPSTRNVLDVCTWQREALFRRDHPIHAESDGSFVCPLDVTYRLRRVVVLATPADRNESSCEEFQIVLRVLLRQVIPSPDEASDRNRTACHLEKITISFRLPCKYPIQSCKMNSSHVDCNNISFRNATVTWKMDRHLYENESIVLSGIVTCQDVGLPLQEENVHIFTGETSCAELDFEAQDVPLSDVLVSRIKVDDNNDDADDRMESRRRRLVHSGKFLVWNPFGEFPSGLPCEFIHIRT